MAKDGDASYECEVLPEISLSSGSGSNSSKVVGRNSQLDQVGGQIERDEALVNIGAVGRREEEAEHVESDVGVGSQAVEATASGDGVRRSNRMRKPVERYIAEPASGLHNHSK